MTPLCLPASLPSHQPARPVSTPEITARPLVPRTRTPKLAHRRAFDAARTHWPGLELSFECFEDHLERVSATEGVPQYAVDLYLCAACLQGDSAAIRELESVHFSALGGVLRRYLRCSDRVQEALQYLRERLLVGPRPRLLSYQGRGPLSGWLRTAASRAAIDHMRAMRRNRLSLREPAPLTESNGSPGEEPSAWSGVHAGPVGDRIGELLEQALRALSPADRGFLRAYYVEDSSVDRLCEAQQLHRATVYRRLRRCEQQLRRHLRQLVRRLALTHSEEELDTLLRNAPTLTDLSSVVRRALLD